MDCLLPLCYFFRKIEDDSARRVAFPYEPSEISDREKNGASTKSAENEARAKRSKWGRLVRERLLRRQCIDCFTYVNGKVSEASVKHAAVGLGFESEQPLLGQVFHFALASSSLAIPSARIKMREIRGLCVVKSLAVP